jgi:integral membrane sensor domain MASE1
VNQSVIARFTIRQLHWTASFLAIGYLLSAAIGIVLTREAGNAAALWPANALLLAVLLRSARADWPAYVLACVVANFTANYALGDSVLVSCGFVIVNTAETLGGAVLLRHFHRGVWDHVSTRQALSFVLLAGIAAPVVGASLGAGLIAWAFQAPYLSVWGVWWVADAMGFLIVTPVVLLATRRRVESLIHQRGGRSNRAVRCVDPGGLSGVLTGPFSGPVSGVADLAVGRLSH